MKNKLISGILVGSLLLCDLAHAQTYTVNIMCTGNGCHFNNTLMNGGLIDEQQINVDSGGTQKFTTGSSFNLNQVSWGNLSSIKTYQPNSSWVNCYLPVSVETTEVQTIVVPANALICTSAKHK